MSELMSPVTENADSLTAVAAAGDRSECRDARLGLSPRSDGGRPADRINVLFLMDEFANPDGGSEQHLMFLLRQLSRELFRMHFAVLGDLRDEHRELFPVEPVVLGRGYRFSLWNAARRVMRLARLIKSVRADVVHAFFQTSETAALLATRLARQGTVLGVRRNVGYWHTRSTLWQARLMRLFRAEYAANCEAAREFAVGKEWIPRQRFAVIRNPLPAKRLDAGLRNVVSAESIGIRNGEQVVGIVAMLRPVKDHATFLRAARLVLDRFPRTRFLVIGRQLPEHFPSIRSLADALGIEEQVLWVGNVENPITMLPHCDVGVLSSSSEGLSNALIEYAGVGIPAVATDVGGNSEVVQDGHTGFVVPPASPEPMAERICRLLADSTLRKTFGQNARRKAEAHYAETKVLEEYVSLYLRIAGKARVPE